MAWDAYFEFAGAEIVNAERFTAYATAARASWFSSNYKGTAISTLTGEVYVNSVVDTPPWGEPDDPATYQFWGVYPLNVTGIEDSTRTAAVTENIGDGGYVAPVRHATKSVVFEVMLAGSEEAAVEAGMRWLKAALLETPCSTAECSGEDLCYFSSEPCLDEGCGDTPDEREECVAEFRRTLKDVRIISGPTITAKRTTSDGDVIWVVTFTAVAGNPAEFGAEILLVEGFGVEADPWVPEIVPADWLFDDDGTPHIDADCARPIYTPVVDPLCPAIEVPPIPPSIPLGCYEAPEEWDRRWFTIPRKYIPYWGDVAPVIRVQAQEESIRSLRLRFYSDPEANGSVLDDPCAYCGDILMSFIPANHTLVFDAAMRTVYAEGPGGDLRRADSLVYKTDGTPFEWPLLTCGSGYVVAVDVPDGSPQPAVDFSLIPRIV